MFAPLQLIPAGRQGEESTILPSLSLTIVARAGMTGILELSAFRRLVTNLAKRTIPRSTALVKVII